MQVVGPYASARQKHSLLMVAADGNPVKPLHANELPLSGGETYDVLLVPWGNATNSLFNISVTFHQHNGAKG